MSVQEVQARIADLTSQLAALTGSPTSSGVLGPAFADALTAATDSTTTTAAPTASLRAATGASAVSLAAEQVGTPYVFGGSKPGGFDCSGLVQWTYAQLGVSLPRTAAEQGKSGTPVSPADAQPGDLIYFDKAGPVDHIGIYAGNGTWVVAPHTGTSVRVESVDLSKATSIRRVAPDAGLSTATTGSWATGLPAAGQRMAPLISQAAAEAGVDPRLLSAVAWSESDFNASSVSSAGAQGVMQLMPRTAEGLGVDALDPASALRGGARYLKTQLDAFGGRVDLALAAYNAGPTAVKKAGGVPPYPETQAYVTRVLDRFHQLGGAT